MGRCKELGNSEYLRNIDDHQYKSPSGEDVTFDIINEHYKKVHTRNAMVTQIVRISFFMIPQNGGG